MKTFVLLSLAIALSTGVKAQHNSTYQPGEWVRISGRTPGAPDFKTYRRMMRAFDNGRFPHNRIFKRCMVFGNQAKVQVVKTGRNWVLVEYRGIAEYGTSTAYAYVYEGRILPESFFH